MKYTEEQIEQYKKELKELVEKQSDTFGRTLMTTKKYLGEFVNYMTPLLQDSDFHYKWSTKCFWVLNDIKEFPTCKNEKCRKELSHINVSVSFGYKQYCNSKCANLDQMVQNKIKNTKFKRYGDQNYNNRDKASKTNLEKYNATSPLGNKEIHQRTVNSANTHREEITKRINDTKEEKYGKRGYNNPEKQLKQI